MDDPDPEPLADGPPYWAFYSLWPRMIAVDPDPPGPGERWQASEPLDERREAAMS